MTALPTDQFGTGKAAPPEDSAPPAGKWTPPPWVMQLGRLVLVCACSAIVGASSATWKVRGMYDDVTGRQDVTDERVGNLKESIKAGFDQMHQDVAEVREDIRSMRREISENKR